MELRRVWEGVFIGLKMVRAVVVIVLQVIKGSVVSGQMFSVLWHNGSRVAGSNVWSLPSNSKFGQLTFGGRLVQHSAGTKNSKILLSN
jgi:hypothetical protein